MQKYLKKKLIRLIYILEEFFMDWGIRLMEIELPSEEENEKSYMRFMNQVDLRENNSCPDCDRGIVQTNLEGFEFDGAICSTCKGTGINLKELINE